jgi:tetratricopeptide (TPR) repeat protein
VAVARRPLARVCLLIVAGVCLTGTPALAVTASELVAQADKITQADDPSIAEVQRAVALYQQAAAIEPGNARIQTKIADVALALGDVAGEEALRWFSLGEAAAERATALDRGDAHAHFLLAANRGKAARRRPIFEVSPLIVAKLEEHLMTALARDPRHARALHMLGMLLRDTPVFLRWTLKGSRKDVTRHLVAATEADPNYAQARLDLAEHYKKEGLVAEARTQAQSVIDMKEPGRVRRWREKHRPAAERLLESLPPP